ncbi:Conserved_hypothetical protein [Hexamita inflata]|uniref:Uncharacterized protein n=1 Tax=Hexamita inflata TaxID=28002 RepID=A0AA86N9S7_9EUKA|nr:Conserved hypothetical protein [Hexamita inflata]
MLVLPLTIHQILTKQSLFTCNNQILKGSQYVNFCSRYYASSKLMAGTIRFYDLTDSQIFLDIGQIQQTVISLQVQVPHLSSFVIFGFTIKTEITECEFKVEIEEDLIQAALICIQCNILISHSTAQFIANGLSVSGLIMKVSDIITIESCKIQFRTKAQLSAAVVLLISQQVKLFKISNVNISSHFQNDLDSNAVLVSQVENVQKLDIILSNVLYCDLKTNFIHTKHESIIKFSQDPKKKCDLCKTNEFMVYGICQNVSLEFSGNENGVEVCVFPFIYNGQGCVCTSGYYFNTTECINFETEYSKLHQYIISNFTLTDLNLARNTSVLNARIDHNISAAYSRLDELNNIIVFNFNTFQNKILNHKSYLETQVIKNFTLLNNNIKSNVSQLNSKIALNQNYLEVNLVSNFSQANSNLARNTTELDNRIHANVTSLTNSITTLTFKVNDNLALITSTLASNKQYLETQIINNASKVNAAITSGIAPIRTNLTNVNNALTTLTTNLRNDLNWVNNDLNAKITAVTNNANNAQARINGVVNDIGGLRAVDTSLQNQINQISARIAPVYWRVIQTPTGYYGAMVNTLQLCVNGDCRSV